MPHVYTLINIKMPNISANVYLVPGWTSICLLYGSLCAETFEHIAHMAAPEHNQWCHKVTFAPIQVTAAIQISTFTFPTKRDYIWGRAGLTTG